MHYLDRAHFQRPTAVLGKWAALNTLYTSFCALHSGDVVTVSGG